MNMVESFLNSTVGLSIPILIAALGLVVSERSGIVNIGAEGFMLCGAFFGYAASVFSQSQWVGAGVAIVSGLLLGLLFAFLVVTVKANQTVIGTAFNILGSAVTITFNRALFSVGSRAVQAATFETIAIPGLSKIPVLGPVLFEQNALAYLAFAILAACTYMMYRTPTGLIIRASGETPQACDTLGINIGRVRYSTILYSTALCGLAGAYLSIAEMKSFTEGMVSGRGFIALAAVIFGRWNPMGVLAAVLLFGAGEALQYRLLATQSEVAYQLFQTIPYVLTLVALVFSVGKNKYSGPAACGVPYVKE